MKASITKQKQEFAPRAIEITFESQAELDMFGAIFNVCAITDLAVANGIDDMAIRERVRELGGDCNRLHRGLVDTLREAFRLRRTN